MYMKKNVKQSLPENIPAATAFTAANSHRVIMQVCPEVLGCELLLYVLADLLVRWFGGENPREGD